MDDDSPALPSTVGITIGPHKDCHYLASGLVSEVYRSKSHALKVITETRDVEPHNPAREVKILNELSHASVIKLNRTFRDGDGRLVLDFPFMPLTLAEIISAGPVSEDLTKKCFHDLFSALSYLHEKGIIHRDIKPSNLLLGSPTGPAYLSDFGTAWHPLLSPVDEPAEHKVLEVGTTCYRAPETLFGNRAYDTSLDLWEAGTMLVECLRNPPQPLFESRDTSEDGNQLGLILSIFKTLGTPTKAAWPEAAHFTTPPFEWYQSFPGKRWDELLPGVDTDAIDLVSRLVYYESGLRLTAAQVCVFEVFNACANINLGTKPPIFQIDNWSYYRQLKYNFSITSTPLRICSKWSSEHFRLFLLVLRIRLQIPATISRSISQEKLICKN